MCKNRLLCRKYFVDWKKSTIFALTYGIAMIIRVIVILVRRATIYPISAVLGREVSKNHSAWVVAMTPHALKDLAYVRRYITDARYLTYWIYR